MIKILIVDDTPYRSERLEETLGFLEVECESVSTLKEAQEKLGGSFDGIITDMSYPIDTDEDAFDRAGDRLLDWLKQKEKNIPILGISTCGFSTDYPCIRGRMSGFVNVSTLKEFIASLKENHDQ